MDKEREYERLSILELETTRIRHQTFTTILSISFVLPGLARESDAIPVQLLGFQVSTKQLVFLLGFVFYLFAVFHYAWYHRYSHRYRKALKDMETELGIRIYQLRARPRFGPFKLHFDWALYIIGIAYGIITAAIVGICIFLGALALIVVAYFALALFSAWRPTEPLERG